MSQVIGLTFSILALTFGTFFFLYALKYYLTLILVLGYSRRMYTNNNRINHFNNNRRFNGLNGLDNGLNGLLNGLRNGWNGFRNGLNNKNHELGIKNHESKDVNNAPVIMNQEYFKKEEESLKEEIDKKDVESEKPGTPKEESYLEESEDDYEDEKELLGGALVGGLYKNIGKRRREKLIKPKFGLFIRRTEDRDENQESEVTNDESGITNHESGVKNQEPENGSNKSKIPEGGIGKGEKGFVVNFFERLSGNSHGNHESRIMNHEEYRVNRNNNRNNNHTRNRFWEKFRNGWNGLNNNHNNNNGFLARLRNGANGFKNGFKNAFNNNNNRWDRLNNFNGNNFNNLNGLGLSGELPKIKLKRQPFISIHLPFYNEKNVADRILTACTNQQYDNYEVIVCDDSTDETVEILEKWKKHPKVKIFHRDTRSGFKGGALRTALEKMDPKTEFIIVFDADFIPYPDTILQFLRYFHVLSWNGINGVNGINAFNNRVGPNNSNSNNFKNHKLSGLNNFNNFNNNNFNHFQNQKNNFRRRFNNNFNNHRIFNGLDNNRGSNADPKRGSNSDLNDEEIDEFPYKYTRIAAVQGYQWHVLNKNENWVTRGVRAEFSGSYVMERSGVELYGGLKQIAGSVYMIRADVLKKYGWGTSITEDFELTLKLYRDGWKVIYTPYIQGPSECLSTLKRLIRQRMRWAEGHTFNVKKRFWEIMKSPYMTFREKLEFLYLSPYYFQAVFFIVGTMFWFLSEAVFHTRLPFWTALWGWSLMLTNMMSLPLMNTVGLFMEESEKRDFLGNLSFLVMVYVVIPFQAYAALKGLLEKEEGTWFRTPKSGHITDLFSRRQFQRWLRKLFPRGVFQPITRTDALQPGTYYLNLKTSRNRFNDFKINKRPLPYLGKAIVAGMLIIAISLSIFASSVPEVLATNPAGIFYLANDDSTVISATATWQLFNNVVDSPSDSTTQVTVGKTGASPRAVKYMPGVSNSAVVNASACSSLSYTSGNGAGWIWDTPFQDNGSIAAGTWTFYIYESDNQSSGVAGIIICVWKVTVTSNQINAGGTLLVAIEDTTPTQDLWDGGVSNFTYTSSEAAKSFNAGDYLYVEYWHYFTTRPSAAGTSTFYTGDITGQDPRIVTPAVEIPEKIIIFLAIIPFIPWLIKRIKKRRGEWGLPMATASQA